MASRALEPIASTSAEQLIPRARSGGGDRAPDRLRKRPFGAAAGIGLALLMAGALFFRLRVHDSVGYLLADAALLGLATATAVLWLS